MNFFKNKRVEKTFDPDQNKRVEKPFDPDQNPDNLYMIPLGGCSSHGIGMNATVYWHQKYWIMVDLGVTFENTPGVDLIVPDMSYVQDRTKQCLGIVITHAHEDHLGGVPYLWETLGKPNIYATPFTAAILQNKFDGIMGKRFINSCLRIIPNSGSFDLGPFSLKYISITHSIPDSNALVIKTSIGNLVHTGDWKIDDTPVVGEKTDYASFKQIANEGVLAVIGDSTNVFKYDMSGSEDRVADALDNTIARCKSGALAVVCFASNTHRIASIIRSGIKHGRKVALLGRSIEEITRIAGEFGYLQDELKHVVDYREIKNIDRNKLLMICTGSQGEIKAALPKMALGKHPIFSLERGDSVIFSSRTIPGNEKANFYIQNKLCLLGVIVISADVERDLHVSGHPSVSELKYLYNILKPQICIPVHGEDRHLQEHAKIAASLNMQTISPHNGDVLHISEKGVAKVGQVRSGRLWKDGKELINKESKIMVDRVRMMGNGTVHISLALDKTNIISLSVSTEGLREKWHKINDEIRSSVKYAVADLSSENVSYNKSSQYNTNAPKFRSIEESRIKEAIFIRVSSLVKHRLDKAPLISIHVHNVK